jgi:HK97 family phage prohead protease
MFKFVDMQQKNELYNFKSGLEIKDVDSASRKVALYLSVFDVIDSDFDIIRKGAFKKSLQERGVGSTSNRKIQYLRFHDWTKQIGKFVELAEDEKGLYAVGELGRSTLGEDALKDYEDGIIREHSIGFKYVKDKVKFIEDESTPIGGFYDVSEVMLFEGSAVTFGANEYTNVVGMKSENKKAEIDVISLELENVIKALANGKGSDERLYSLEMQAKQLSAKLVLLASLEPTLKGYSLEASEPKIDAIEVTPFSWVDVVNKVNF